MNDKVNIKIENDVYVITYMDHVWKGDNIVKLWYEVMKALILKNTIIGFDASFDRLIDENEKLTITYLFTDEEEIWLSPRHQMGGFPFIIEEHMKEFTWELLKQYCNE